VFHRSDFHVILWLKKKKKRRNKKKKKTKEDKEPLDSETQMDGALQPVTKHLKDGFKVI